MAAKLNALDSTLASRMFYIGRDTSSKTYYFKTFKRNMCIVANGLALTYTASQSFCWQLIPRGTSYAILFVNPAGQRYVLGAWKQDTPTRGLSVFSVDTISSAGNDKFEYLWDLTREGEALLLPFKTATDRPTNIV